MALGGGASESTFFASAAPRNSPSEVFGFLARRGGDTRVATLAMATAARSPCRYRTDPAIGEVVSHRHLLGHVRLDEARVGWPQVVLAVKEAGV